MHSRSVVLLIVAAVLAAYLLPAALCTEPTYTLAASLDGRALAYADYNADSLLDVLAVGANQSQLLLYLWQKDVSGGVSAPREVRLADLPAGSRLVGAAPADFNGDSLVDVLMTVQTAGRSGFAVWIVYGLSNRSGATEPTLVTSAVDQPTVLDYNADMVADFLVETSPGHLVVFTGRHNENRFDNSTDVFPGALTSPLAVPNANLFTDMDGDLRSDLVLRLDGSASPGVVMKRLDSVFQKLADLPAPDGVVDGDYIGQMVPLSLDNDELMDLAMPACRRNSDGSCATSWLYLYYGASRKWCRAKVDEFDTQKYNWHLQSPQPVQLRAGDLDLDGRLDLLATLLRRVDGRQLVAFLTPSDDSGDCAKSPASSVTAGLREVALLACPEGLAVSGSALADVNQDGGLDLVLLCSGGERWVSQFYAQQYNEEGYFFRSLVLNGMCPNAYNCPGGRLPVGLPVPGPCLHFTTEKPQGGTRHGIGCQLSQSAYGQLDLPYLHFGLGQFSNYIDRLTVAIPYAKSPPELRRDFTFIIPNSQLLVVPYPPGNPASWTSELFVRPFYDKQVLYVGVTLLGTCLIACAIAAVFQCLEYRRDKLERVSGQQGVVFDPSGR